MSAGNILRYIVAALDAAGIPSMVAGSFAAGFHGVQRSTYDIDIVIDPSKEALDKFLHSLDQEAYYVSMDAAHDALRRRSMFNVIEMASNWKVDLIVRKNRPFSVEEMQRRAEGTILGVDLHVTTVEDSILSKLEWAKAGESNRQLEDVRELVKVHGSRLDRPYLERWIAELELEEQWRKVQP